MAILMHGDAAFAGQGLVAESLDLSDLGGYRIGGTIHFVVNNQIGFTTLPTYSRSGPYCTEVAKIVQAPILHVNGDDPEAVVHVCRIATEFRQHFKRDIVIDMFCYRRYGHNESDEPMFTQPLMYKEIGGHKTVKEVYAARLEAEGIVTAADVQAMDAELRAKLDKALEAATNYKPNKADWLEGKWSGMTIAPGEEDRKGITAVDTEMLLSVGRAISEPPRNFELNRKITRLLQEKRKAIDTGKDIDWATGEALAFGTLLAEGTPVRLSGQDSGRGTFSQRHSVLIDQANENKYIPLNHVADGQAKFEVIDSPLNEAGGARLRVRLFVGRTQCAGAVGGAVRRLRQRRAGHHRPVHLLGREQVAAHERPRDAAAARLRGPGARAQLGAPRALPAALGRGQLAGRGADHAGQLLPCAAPADASHLPQAADRDDAEVAAAPQGLRLDPGRLRAGLVVPPHPAGDRPSSRLDAKIERVVLCSGKVYFDLVAERRKRKIDNIAIMRIEQLYPFPINRLGVRLSQYPNAEVVWCQEEPENMGGWHFVDRRIDRALSTIEVRARRPVYIGRPESASPATGSARTHLKEQADLVDRALTVG